MTEPHSTTHHPVRFLVPLCPSPIPVGFRRPRGAVGRAEEGGRSSRRSWATTGRRLRAIPSPTTTASSRGRRLRSSTRTPRRRTTLRLGTGSSSPAESSPRSETNDDYLAACRECGIRTYRRNTQSWLFYREMNEGGETTFRSAAGYADAFVNLSGYQVHDPAEVHEPLPVDVPASRFLYRRRAGTLRVLRRRRTVLVRRLPTNVSRFGRSRDRPMTHQLPQEPLIIMPLRRPPGV